jgi:uncharacterized protein YkwD
MKRTLKHRILSLIALTLILSMLFGIGAAAAYMPDPGIEGIAELFNNSVNPIKEQRPAFEMNKSQGITGTDSEQVAEIIGKAYNIIDLIGILSSFLAGNMDKLGPFKALIEAATGLNLDELKQTFETATGSVLLKNSSEEKTDLIFKGTDCDSIVSVSGEPYVSALTTADIGSYDFIPEYSGAYSIKISINDEINPTKESAMGRVFDLVNTDKLETFVKTIIPDFDIDKAVLKYQNAYAECRVNAQGQLIYYKTHYEINLGLLDSFKDSFEFIDFSEVEFFDQSIYIVEAEYKNFNWNPLLFGDLNSDEKIDAGDARVALRAAAKLFNPSDIQVLAGDINGDGKLNAADARLLLRHAAKLDTIEYKLIPTARQNAETEENNGSEEPSSGSFASDEQVLAASGAFEEGCLYEVGDADANGKVDAADARIILRFAAKLDNYKGTLINVLDLNDDEKVNAADARIVLRCAARLDKHPGTQRFVYDCDLYKPKPGSNNNNNDGPREPLSKYFDKPSKKYEDLNDFEYRVVELVNIERTKRGLMPLEISFELSEIARKRSVDMANGLPFSHYHVDKYGNEYGDGIAFELMQERGIRYKWAGENIAAGQETPQDVVDAWMNSPDHKANILRPEFTSIGVGFTDETITIYDTYWTQTYWTQIFAAPYR